MEKARGIAGLFCEAVDFRTVMRISDLADKMCHILTLIGSRQRAVCLACQAYAGRVFFNIDKTRIYDVIAEVGTGFACFIKDIEEYGSSRIERCRRNRPDSR